MAEKIILKASLINACKLLDFKAFLLSLRRKEEERKKTLYKMFDLLKEKIKDEEKFKEVAMCIDFTKKSVFLTLLVNCPYLDIEPDEAEIDLTPKLAGTFQAFEEAKK